MNVLNFDDLKVTTNCNIKTKQNKKMQWIQQQRKRQLRVLLCDLQRFQNKYDLKPSGQDSESRVPTFFSTTVPDVFDDLYKLTKPHFSQINTSELG